MSLISKTLSLGVRFEVATVLHCFDNQGFLSSFMTNLFLNCVFAQWTGFCVVNIGPRVRYQVELGEDYAAQNNKKFLIVPKTNGCIEHFFPILNRARAIVGFYPVV